MTFVELSKLLSKKQVGPSGSSWVLILKYVNHRESLCKTGVRKFCQLLGAPAVSGTRAWGATWKDEIGKAELRSWVFVSSTAIVFHWIPQLSASLDLVPLVAAAICCDSTCNVPIGCFIASKWILDKSRKGNVQRDCLGNCTERILDTCWSQGSPNGACW